MVTKSFFFPANLHNELPNAQYETRRLSPYTENSNLPATQESASPEQPLPKLRIGATRSDSDRQGQVDDSDVLNRYVQVGSLKAVR